VEAVAGHLADKNSLQGMLHNSSLLLGQLARASVAFRRRLASNVPAMEALVGLLQSSDTDLVCNTLWALRSIVVEGTHRDATVRRRTASILKPLLGSSDGKVLLNAKALNEILRRPIPISVEKTEDDEGALALASILYTPPPCANPRGNGTVGVKRKGTAWANDDTEAGEQNTKRLARQQVFDDDEEDDTVAAETQEAEGQGAAGLGALAFLSSNLLSAAEG